MTDEEIAILLTEHGQHIKSNAHRIDELEEAQKEMRDLVRSVDKLAQSMQTMATEQERQGKQIDSLETSKNDTFKFWLRTILAAVATCFSPRSTGRSSLRRQAWRAFSAC